LWSEPERSEWLARSSAGPDTAAADSQQASPRRRGQRQDLPISLDAVIDSTVTVS
jgi:hypothetical protein